MRIELLFIFIMLFIFLIIGQSLNAKQIKSEKYYQQKYCSSIGATIEARIGRVRIDCLTKEYAIEVDFAKKKYEGVGQSLYYAMITDKKPMLVLIAERENRANRSHIAIAREICREYDIRLVIIK